MNISNTIHFYGTNNLEKTHDFYVNVCFLELLKDQKKCHIYGKQDVFYIGFCTHIDVVNKPKSPIITFLVDDVKAWHTHISDHCKVSDVETNDFYHIEHFFCTDPNGYTLEFQRFLDEGEQT